MRLDKSFMITFRRLRRSNSIRAENRANGVNNKTCTNNNRYIENRAYHNNTVEIKPEIIC